MTFGERLQQVRRAAGLSQEQLGELIGMSRQAVSKWETDQAAPDIATLALLCGVLGVSADELLGQEAPPRRAEGAPPVGGLEECVRINAAKRCFTAGWVTAVIGVVLLIVEFFSLLVIQVVDLETTHGWYSNAMEYAAKPPMPVIFGITGAVLAAGIAVAVGSVLAMQGKGPSKAPKAP